MPTLKSRQCTAIFTLIHPWGCIRKYIPIGQLVLAVLRFKTVFAYSSTSAGHLTSEHQNLPTPRGPLAQTAQETPPTPPLQPTKPTWTSP